MSLDYYFYVETKRSGEWKVPAGFEHEEYQHKRLGEFTWIRGKSPVADLFFGASAVFPFRREIPRDRGSSAIFQYLDSFYNYQIDEMRLSWIPYTDLLVDLWDEM